MSERAPSEENDSYGFPTHAGSGAGQQPWSDHTDDDFLAGGFSVGQNGDIILPDDYFDDSDIAKKMEDYYGRPLSELAIDQQRLALRRFFFKYEIDGLTDFEIAGWVEFLSHPTNSIDPSSEGHFVDKFGINAARLFGALSNALQPITGRLNTKMGAIDTYISLIDHHSQFIEHSSAELVQIFLEKIVAIIDDIYSKTNGDTNQTRHIMALFSDRLHCVTSHLLDQSKQNKDISLDISLINSSIYSTALLFKQQLVDNQSSRFGELMPYTVEQVPWISLPEDDKNAISHWFTSERERRLGKIDGYTLRQVVSNFLHQVGRTDNIISIARNDSGKPLAMIIQESPQDGCISLHGFIARPELEKSAANSELFNTFARLLLQDYSLKFKTHKDNSPMLAVARQYPNVHISEPDNSGYHHITIPRAV